MTLMAHKKESNGMIEIFTSIDWEFWGPLLSILILICMSAFFSGSETALTAVSKARMHALEKDGNKKAKRVNILIERKDRLIGSLLLGNNLVNILASAIATKFFIDLVGEAGVVYATLIMTVVVLVFAEVLPKTIALNNSDTVALLIAPVVRALVIVLTPFTAMLSVIVTVTMKIMRIKQGSDNLADIAQQELRGAIDLAHQSGGEDGERESLEKRAMLRSILDLVDVDVEEVMTHRSNVTAIDADEPITHIVDQVLSCPYTRIPVWQDDNDNIIGVVHAKALLRELRAAGGNIDRLDIRMMVSEPWFIPETTTLFDQLQAFRERKEHFAVVVDEYGAFQGIVTLEDILEEIVGEIEDEHDTVVTGIRLQGDGSYLIDGTVTIRDLNRELEWELPDEDYTTIAGLVIHESKMIPDVGQNFSFYGYRFKVLKRDKNQISLLGIIPPVKKG